MDRFIARRCLPLTLATLCACGGGGDSSELASMLPSGAQARAEAKAHASDGVLDAQHWPAAAPYSYFSNATTALNPPAVMQPVTAIATGVLTKVSLNLCVTGTSGHTVIQIRRAAAFLSPVVATAQTPRSGSPVWGTPACPGASDLLASGQASVDFDLSAANIGVTAGERLSITLVRTDTTGANDIWFQDFNGDRTPSSSNWLVMAQIEGSQTDAFGFRLRFKTFVAPFASPVAPLPATNGQGWWRRAHQVRPSRPGS